MKATMGPGKARHKELSAINLGGDFAMNQEAERIVETGDRLLSHSTSASRHSKFSVEPGDHYDRVTDAWRLLIGDDLHVGYFSEIDCSLAEATTALSRLMAESAKLTPGSEVLDVGCGTGNPAIYLAREHKCRVVGISNSSVGIKRAEARAREKGMAVEVRFCVADGTATGFENESFDVTWVMESSHLMREKELLIQECARVLRPGGRVVLCDLVLRRPMLTRLGVALCHDLMILEEVYGKSTLQFGETYIRQFEQWKIATEGRDVSEQVLPTFAHWRHNAERRASEVSEILGEAALDKFVRSCEIMTRLFQTGQFGYYVVAGRKRE
jgi:27-O-demethylrifamycin SV methyltransferase